MEKPPISRLALAAMASNTGCTSEGEAAITFKMSAVAVCRSSASPVSLNSRAFSIAITAWSANVWSSCTWSGANAPGSARVTLIMPTGVPRFISGMNSTLRKPRSRARSRFSSGTSLGLAVGKLDRLAAANQREGREIRDPARERCLQPFVGVGAGRRERHEVQLVADELKHGGGEAAEQALRAGRDRREHRPRIGGRCRDGAQDLGAGVLAKSRAPRSRAFSAAADCNCRSRSSKLLGDIVGRGGHS